MATKGEMIRRDIENGLSDKDILTRVDTTLNSVRWHRSKMRHASLLKPAATAAALTVGEALIKFGLDGEVRECLQRLKATVDSCRLNAIDLEKMYRELASWGFVTNSRVSGRFGRCNYRKRTIEVHEKLLGLADDLRQTFLHECAHALDRMIHGRSSSHGAEWKFIMAIGFRIPARRCGGHSDEATSALSELRTAKAVETWKCERCGTEMPIMRRRKYPASMYNHRRCGGKFARITP